MKKHNTEADYLKIRRKYRIEVPDNLKEFWSRAELENISNSNTHFHFHILRILSIQNVIDYKINKIRSWFKEKARLKYITYFIPIAEVVNTNDIMILGFDQYKSPKGLFLFNDEIEPVFITKELRSLLITKNIQHQYGDDFRYLNEKVVAPFIFEDSNENNIDGILDFIKNCMSKVLWGNELNIEKLDNSIKIAFKDQVITRSIMVEVEEYIDHDEIVSILDFLNSYIWTSASIQINYYGFYKINEGIVFLYHDELIEFVRKGLVRFYFNVEMPSCIFIDRVNNYVNEPATEEEKALLNMSVSQVFNHYESAGMVLEVEVLKRKDIQSIIDYYFDSKSSDLVLDGIDELKIKSEEDFYLEIDNVIQGKAPNKNRTYLSWSVNNTIKGHSYFECIDKKEVIQFQFYYRDMSWEDEKVSIELLNKSLQCIIAQSNPNTIISKVNKEDINRINILTRNGFKQILVETAIINEIGLEQSLVVFEKKIVSKMS